MSERSTHWNSVYQRKKPIEVSWYRAHLEQSLAFIHKAALPLDAAILDVGGGASTLVDDLLADGRTNITVLDISEEAIAATKLRLGDAAARVHWLVGDVTQIELTARAYDLWHDRAVFHFLGDLADRKQYVTAAGRSLKLGGHLIVATFGPEGPQKCSGLDVVRYSPEQLAAEFADHFDVVESAVEVHSTPGGATQQFVYCHFRRKLIDRQA